MKYSKKLTPVILLMAILAGCDNNDVNFVPPPVPPPPPPTTQSQFGAGFEAAFEKGKFEEPNAVTVGDIIDLDKTKDPLDIPDPGQ